MPRRCKCLKSEKRKQRKGNRWYTDVYEKVFILSDALFDADDMDKNPCIRKCIGKVRFWSKTEALNLAGKYHKLFVDRSEVTGNQVNVNALVSDEDAARLIDSLVSRAQEAKGGGTNGKENS